VSYRRIQFNYLDIEARGDASGLIEAPVELHDNLAGAMVVN